MKTRPGNIRQIRELERLGRKHNFFNNYFNVQYELSQRCYELLELPRKKGQCLLLDIGCGSGISGEVLTENGHEWIGCDISRNMLGLEFRLLLYFFL
jgi:18S rRNA (guanine1575-N7)-methyltransferase